MITEKGYIGHFTCKMEEKAFYVFELVTDTKKITCVGNAKGFGEGETVEVTGDIVDHPVYRKQLRIASIKGLSPEDKVAIERYLGSGAIKGIGAALAKRIVNKFGEETFDIATREPERLAEVNGISLKKAYDIGAQLEEKRDLRDAMMFLGEYGISQNLANKIYEKYGLETYGVIKNNPYRLAEEIQGVGFKTADDIAKKSGISIDSSFRIRCGLYHCLNQCLQDGHTCYPQNLLFEKAAELLGVTEESLDNELLDLALDKKVIIKKINDVDYVYLYNYFFMEVSCAKNLLELRDAYDNPISLDSDEMIMKKIEKIGNNQSIELDELQKNAVLECVKNGVFILSGGPGTGKTTTINTILEYFANEGVDFLLAAPTGRAAKRMTETTGYEAKTIHRLLEINGEMSDEHVGMHFERNMDNPLEADAIVIDEMSMVDIGLMNALLKAIVPGTKLILVGDVDQLASVGPGQILKDIMESEAFAFVRLEKIFRQDADSHIISNAYRINHGQMLDFSEKNKDFFFMNRNNYEEIYSLIEYIMKEKIEKNFGVDSLECQILSPMRKGALGVECLNEVLRERLNPQRNGIKECEHGGVTYREGDKVMQIKNNYNLEWEVLGKYNIKVDSGEGVFNGDLGTIKRIDTYLKQVTVEFDDLHVVNYSYDQLEELELAYATTIHKAQGSEYPVVIIPLVAGPAVLLTKNLLYTAVTRAEKCVILLGDENAFKQMICNNRIQTRYTTLKDRLIAYDN